ncbi:hypothetical protein PVAND_004924 [Polypedilum vanderplanki]|uniref:Zinc finger CCHC domain-containing protein 2 n=1 Tax=Polypedilum vanderplanki TaxID=319348 RepID=A0A9J6C0H7_POLVA|nr:hypothetical protein PVAND_004924 [Polypedilum vanderplanki]
MICKDDLVTWFKKLESYKRIDVMCTLLNLCLPFELRFLGTCLEELGRRDAQDLRGVELRVNNSQEFISEIMSFQQGQPTDIKLRRKMALYLALMRACNRTGVNELFRTLDRWGDRDFTKFSDGDPLQELLLVFTMATNHPVFSFEQRIKCGEIYSKIISSKAHLNQQSSSTSSPITSPLSSTSSFTVQQQQHQPASPPPFQSATTFQPPQSAPPPPQLINPAATQQQLPNPMLMPMAFPQATLIPSGDPASLTLSVDSLPSHSHLVPAPPNMNMVQIPADFSTPPPWQMRYQPPIYSTIVPIEAQPPQYPPQTSSPHLSQPSSPTHSRTGSPSRQQQQTQSQQQTNQNPPPPQSASHRTSRIGRNRPSTETTPPPLQPSNAQTQGSGTINYMGNNDIMVQTLKSFEDLNVDGAISQLHSIRNGYNRPSNAIQRQNHKTNWTTLQWQLQQQQQQQQQQQAHNVYPVHMEIQMIPPHKSSTTTTGSESGSGSSGDISPPPSSAVTQNSSDHGNSGIRNKQTLNLNRLNGGSSSSSSGGGGNGNQNQLHQNNSNSSNIDFNGTTSQTNPNVANTTTLVSSNSSGNLLHIGGPIHNYPTYRNMPGTATIQRQFPAPINGEINLFPFSPGATFIATQPPVVTNVVAQPPQSARVSPSQTPPVILPTPYPTNKLVQSCFNCGSINHTGLNCSEASMEDVTRNAIYKLDYTVSTQPAMMQQFSVVPIMTTSLSSGNLNNQMQNSNSNLSVATTSVSSTHNSESEPIPFIDLTQDTSSDSSISNR